MIDAAPSMHTGPLAQAKGSDLEHLNSNHASPLAFKALLFFFFIMYVAPQALIPGLEPLHLAKISAVLAIAAYGFSRLVQGQQLTVFTKEIKLILWFVVVAIVSIPLSQWPGGSWDFFTDTYSKSVILFFLVVNLLVNQKRCRQMLWAITIFSAFNAVIGVDRYLSGEVVGGYRVKGGYSGLSADPNDLALSLNLAIPFMWYLFESSKRTFQKMLAGSMLVLAVVGVILSYSRGGFLALIGLFLWFAWIRFKNRGAAVLVKAAFIGMLVLAFFPSGYSDRVLSIFDSSKDDTGSGEVRLIVMKEAVNIVVQHPLGAGLKMHNLLVQKAGAGWAGVHSVYLEIAADLGLIGGVLFVVIHWKLIRAMQHLRTSPALRGSTLRPLAEATEVSLIAFAVGGMFLAVAYLQSFYILAGITLAVKIMAMRQYPNIETVHQYKGQPAFSRTQ